jgi:hypothetical protein
MKIQFLPDQVHGLCPFLRQFVNAVEGSIGVDSENRTALKCDVWAGCRFLRQDADFYGRRYVTGTTGHETVTSNS